MTKKRRHRLFGFVDKLFKINTTKVQQQARIFFLERGNTNARIYFQIILYYIYYLCVKSRTDRTTTTNIRRFIQFINIYHTYRFLSGSSVFKMAEKILKMIYTRVALSPQTPIKTICKLNSNTELDNKCARKFYITILTYKNDT